VAVGGPGDDHGPKDALQGPVVAVFSRAVSHSGCVEDAFEACLALGAQVQDVLEDLAEGLSCIGKEVGLELAVGEVGRPLAGRPGDHLVEPGARRGEGRRR